MNTTSMRRRTSGRPVIIEAMEGRLLMSGDALTTTPDTQPIGMLLPAIQAAREAARRAQISDGTSNTIMVAETYQKPSTFQVTFGGSLG
jgi:hypothetical protein